MKKYFFISTMFVFAFSFGQQEVPEGNTDSFKFHSVSIGIPFLSYYAANNSSGLHFDAVATYSYNKHLFSMDLEHSEEIVILGRNTESISQLNFLYGREFGIARTVFAELHGGSGVLLYNATEVDPNKLGNESAYTIGFPIKGKIRVHTGPRFSIGLQGGLNFNNLKSTSTFGFFLQWSVGKW